MPRIHVSLTERELTAVLAALRHWHRDDDGSSDDWHFHGGVSPLTTTEIDQLCDRLNR